MYFLLINDIREHFTIGFINQMKKRQMIHCSLLVKDVPKILKLQNGTIHLFMKMGDKYPEDFQVLLGNFVEGIA